MGPLGLRDQNAEINQAAVDHGQVRITPYLSFLICQRGFLTPSSLPLCEYRYLVINKDCSGGHLFIIIIIIVLLLLL